MFRHTFGRTYTANGGDLDNAVAAAFAAVHARFTKMFLCDSGESSAPVFSVSPDGKVGELTLTVVVPAQVCVLTGPASSRVFSAYEGMDENAVWVKGLEGLLTHQLRHVVTQKAAWEKATREVKDGATPPPVSDYVQDTLLEIIGSRKPDPVEGQDVVRDAMNYELIPHTIDMRVAYLDDPIAGYLSSTRDSGAGRTLMSAIEFLGSCSRDANFSVTVRVEEEETSSGTILTMLS